MPAPNTSAAFLLSRSLGFPQEWDFDCVIGHDHLSRSLINDFLEKNPNQTLGCHLLYSPDDPRRMMSNFYVPIYRHSDAANPVSAHLRSAHMKLQRLSSFAPAGMDLFGLARQELLERLDPLKKRNALRSAREIGRLLGLEYKSYQAQYGHRGWAGPR